MGDVKKTNRWNNIKAQLADGSVRLRYCGGLVIMVTAASIGYLMLRHAKSAMPVESSQFATAPEVAALSEQLPLSQLPPATHAYDSLLAEQNAAAAAAAKQTGESEIPVMRPNMAAQPISDANASQIAEPLPVTPSQPKLTEIATVQPYPDIEHWQQAIAAQAAAMRPQVNLLIAAWQPKEHVSLTMPELTQSVSQESKTKEINKEIGPEQDTTKLVQANPKSSQIVLRAGELSYAVLDTAINTDEPGPVTATIVQGALKGTKLLGKIEMGQSAQKVGLHFTLASIPAQQNSVAIDAWAIDPETARTALATKVDQHYLMRYGTFFAASFLGGFSDALLQGGQRQQLISNPLGTTIQQEPYTTQQLLLAGTGNIGKQVANNLAGLINRPATITVNAGIGIGVLFMADLRKR